MRVFALDDERHTVIPVENVAVQKERTGVSVIDERQILYQILFEQL